jgi:hypothetical protein
MQVGDRHVARREAALTPLILKRGSASRSQRRDDDYDVLEKSVVVGRIFVTPAAPAGRQWMWASGHGGHIKRAAHDFEATREAAMNTRSLYRDPKLGRWR